MSQIVLAYDGSTHGDWVAHYAIRLARASGEEGLEVVHVDDRELSEAELESRIAQLRAVAEASGVELALRTLSGTGASVSEVLEAAVPAGTGRIIVSGLRRQASGRGLLRGTVSEQLFRLRRHDVLALRVVSPGLLGHARHILLSLSQHPHAAARAGFFLLPFAPELTRLSLLTVLSPRFGRLASPTGEDVRALRRRGLDHLLQAESQLRRAVAPFEIPFDAQVAVSWDWPTEITRLAGRARAELLLVGWTGRTLARRSVLGNPLEQVLRDAVCDVAIFSRARGTLP